MSILCLYNYESIDKIKPARLSSHRLVNFLILEAGAFVGDFKRFMCHL